MNEYGWLIAGLTAASGMIAMFWSYVRSVWSQLSSHIIVTVQIDGRLAFAVNSYAWKRFKPTRYGRCAYTGWTMFVRPVKRAQLIAMNIRNQY